jgi:hypothetical protein
MASGGFFSGLSGDIRFTDSRINGPGPLPTDLGGGPQGVYGQADGVYNGTSQLLENIVPYSQPGKGNLNANKGPQTAHRVAAGIPRVELPEPEPDTVSTFSLFHSVDNGDVAFIVTPVSTQKYVWLSSKPYPMQSQKHLNSLVNVNVFLNIVQVNYVLAGIFNRLWYRLEKNILHPENSNAWDSLIASFGTYAVHCSDNIVKLGQESKKSFSDELDRDFDTRIISLFVFKTFLLLQHIIKFHIKPFGICAGSEKQGGQHEGRDKPVQAAASYFTTLTVDGQNRDLVNIWRNNEIEGGDQLIMHLAPVRRSSTVLYTLNHYNHGTVSKYMNFPKLNFCVIQIIPTFFKAGELPEYYRNEQDSVYKQVFGDMLKGAENIKKKDGSSNENQQENFINLMKMLLDHRSSGFWHCAQTYTKSARYGHVLAPFSDHEYMTGALMQVNWAPVWKEEKKFDWLTDDVIQELAEMHANEIKSSDYAFLTYNTEVTASQLRDFLNDNPFFKDGFSMLDLMTLQDKRHKFGETLDFYARKFIYNNIVSKKRGREPEGGRVEVPRVVMEGLDAPMQTLLPERTMTRVAARVDVTPKQRASTLPVDSTTAATAAATSAAAAAATSVGIAATTAAAAATAAAVAKAGEEPEPRKRSKVPKAATLPTQTAEELELERIFERRGADK